MHNLLVVEQGFRSSVLKYRLHFINLLNKTWGVGSLVLKKAGWLLNKLRWCVTCVQGQFYSMALLCCRWTCKGKSCSQASSPKAPNTTWSLTIPLSSMWPTAPTRPTGRFSKGTAQGTWWSVYTSLSESSYSCDGHYDYDHDSLLL